MRPQDVDAKQPKTFNIINYIKPIFKNKEKNRPIVSGHWNDDF